MYTEVSELCACLWFLWVIFSPFPPWSPMLLRKEHPRGWRSRASQVGFLESAMPGPLSGWHLLASFHSVPLLNLTTVIRIIRPALFSDFRPFSASSGRRWMDLVIPLALFPRACPHGTCGGDRKYTVVIGHEEALYEGSMPGVFISLWPGRPVRHLSLGKAPLHLRPVVRGSGGDCPPEGWRLGTGGPSGDVLELCWIRQLPSKDLEVQLPEQETKMKERRKRKVKVSQQCNHKGKAPTGRQLWAPGLLHTAPQPGCSSLPTSSVSRAPSPEHACSPEPAGASARTS